MSEWEKTEAKLWAAFLKEALPGVTANPGAHTDYRQTPDPAKEAALIADRSVAEFAVRYGKALRIPDERLADARQLLSQPPSAGKESRKRGGGALHLRPV